MGISDFYKEHKSEIIDLVRFYDTLSDEAKNKFIETCDPIIYGTRKAINVGNGRYNNLYSILSQLRDRSEFAVLYAFLSLYIGGEL